MKVLYNLEKYLTSFIYFYSIFHTQIESCLRSCLMLSFFKVKKKKKKVRGMTVSLNQKFHTRYKRLE